MNLNTVGKIVVSALFFLALPNLMLGQTKSDSLAQIARQKPEKRATKVITEEDLPPRTEESSRVTEAMEGKASSSSDESQGQVAASEAQAGNTDSSEAQARLEVVNSDEASLADEITQMEKTLTTEPNPGLRAIISDSLKTKKANLEALQNERKQLEKTLAPSKTEAGSTKVQEQKQ